MKIIDPILCAACNKEVERVECHENPMTMSRTFRVYCHGEMEESTLDDLDLHVASSIRGIAFVKVIPIALP